jgi:hypothetical protein
MPMENRALEAVGKAGSVAESIGAKFAEEDMKSRREAEFTKGSTEAAWELFNKKMELLSKPEFFTDPVSTVNAFGPYSQEIQKKHLSGIKDQHVQDAFKRQFGQEALRSMEHLATEAHKQSQHVDRGALLQAVNRYETMAGMDPNMHDAMDSLDKASGIYNRMSASGLMEPEKSGEAVKKMYSTWTHARIQGIALDHPDQAKGILEDTRGISQYLNDEQRTKLAAYVESRQDHIKTHSETEQKRAEEAQMKAENDKAFLDISHQLAGKDPDDPAWEDVRNHIQENSAGFGLTVHAQDQAMKLSGDVETMQKQRRDSKDREHKRADDKLMGEVLTKDIPIDQINAYPGASAKGREAAVRWINSDEAKRNRTDQTLYGKLVSDIDAHKITDPDDLNGYLAAGLGKSDYHQLRNMIETQRDPDKAPDLKYAKEAFFSKYSVSGQLPDSVRSLYPRFISQYEEQVRKQTLKGGATHELADRMLQDVDKAVIHSWSGWTTGTALDYAQSWGSFPEPEIDAPEITPANIPRRKDMPDPLGIR